MRAHAFDLATGAERWQVDVDGKGSPEVPPAALPGFGGVLVPDRLGGLSLVDHDGRRRWRARSSGVAVRGGPAALSVAGPFAFPLDAGAVWLSGPSRRSSFLSPSGRVSGVAEGPAGVLLVATREAPTNGLTAYEISP